MKKITVIGAGNVGATCANVIAQKDLAREVVLVDIKEGVAEGKALDIWQTSSILNFNTKVTGVTNDYLKTKGSGVVVITSGIPRKPGMSRDDLIKTNAGIVKSVTEKVVRYSPDAIIIVVSNPLDIMTYTAFQAANKDSQKVFGMAGILDSGRYKAFIADALNVSPKGIHGLLLGGHGDTMVPLPRFTSVSGIPITDLLNQEELDSIVERTRKGGGELVKLMGTSAWYAPGAAAAQMVEAIVDDQKRMFPVCTCLKGHYGLKNVYLGVPVKLGSLGIEEIIELDLTDKEKKMLHDSADHVKKMMKTLDDMKIFANKNC
ncbi:MAG: malate dehydrogenase [Bacteroidales bacterium]|nr:malate dehydrogenase [Bacteroidales bacterium]